jgi:hypothetical protein
MNVTFAALASLSLVMAAPRAPSVGSGPRTAELRRSLDEMVSRLLPADGFVRADGHVYASDLALLAISAALGLERNRYEELVALISQRFVQRPAGLSNPIVLERRRLHPSLSRPEASGTLEALQVAQALFLGAGTFGREGDAVRARRILEGYLEHADEIAGVWLVRTSFDLQSRRFATNSYLIDYAPDVLDFAAAQRDSERYRLAATRSLDLIRKAQRPNGLIDAIVQPELRPMFPFVIFSPNDVIAIEHTTLVAEQVAASAPDIGQKVLRFASSRLATLHAAYEGRSGNPHGIDRADAGTLATLVRLAVKLGDRDFIEKIRPLFAQHASWVARQEGTVDIQLVAQTLLGLQYLERWEQNRALPRAVPFRSPRS